MAVFRLLSSVLFPHYLLLHLLLPLLFLGHKVESRQVQGAEMVISSHHRMLEMKSLVPASTCNTPPRDRVGSLPLVHRQGPCSPLHEERRQHHNSTLVFLRDQSRINSIRYLLASPSTPGIPAGQGFNLNMPVVASSEGSGEFVVTVGLGTPTRYFPLIFDTGSDLTWTRCLPCQTEDCCPQPDRCFEPSKSTTYSEPKCTLPRCDYSITYADNSFSSGYFVNDTLTLGPNYQFPNFIFGCAQESSDGFGTSAGMLGLARGDNSLIQQTGDTFALIFCYCIPATHSSQGYLLFGFGALQKCQTDQYTNILPERYGSFYYVKLLGITIGNQNLDFSKLAPSASPSKTIIDSGTTISRLPSSIYSALRDKFKNQMSGYPVAEPLDYLRLDTCYNLEGHENVALPSMVLNFDGVDVNVDPSGVVWRESDSQVCLAFSEKENEDDLTIIGSTQQRKLNILYNIQDNKVEFGTGCSS